MDLKNKRIIISKTNQIGDVIFALPLASAIKQLEPTATVIFLGTHYTRELIEHYQDVDEFVDWNEIYRDNDEAAAVKHLQALNADIIIHVRPKKTICRVAKKAKIQLRIGSRSRFYCWFTCNRLISISRKKCELHETQYDMMFMQALGGKTFYSLDEIIALRHFKPLPKSTEIQALLDPQRFNLILHPKTRGEHIEWSPAHFAELIRLLPEDKFKIFVTGSQAEGDKVRDIMLTPFPHVVDLCGKITLSELMKLIQNIDGLVCASTGPVHVAAAFAINTLGLYAPIRPFHAGRWGPVGKHATSITIDKKCEDCRRLTACHCINEITPEQVRDVIIGWYNLRI
ncbi:MAG: glycosyltransferase family 9 protein [Gammaproteobacteria bacterium]|jgi:ADP-heptose:LPS heptosyltransferase